jgi:hypothetical protein
MTLPRIVGVLLTIGIPLEFIDKNRRWAIGAVALQLSMAIASTAAAAEAIGTGVSIALPASMQRGPLGAYFTEPSGHTIVQILVGSKENAVENGPLFRTLYPVRPRQVDRDKTKARLYKRTRSENGGGWDGWSYNILGRESALNVSVMYTGSDSEWFESFESVFETLDWDEQQLDSEQSFQARIAVPGLKLVPRQVGVLSFTPDGRPGTPVPSLMVQVMPVTSAQADQVFPGICETDVLKKVGGGESSGPHMFEGDGISGCDSWGTDKDRVLYVVVLRTEDGAVLSGIGNLAPDNFEAFTGSFRNSFLQMKRVK